MNQKLLWNHHRFVLISVTRTIGFALAQTSSMHVYVDSISDPPWRPLLIQLLEWGSSLKRTLDVLWRMALTDRRQEHMDRFSLLSYLKDSAKMYFLKFFKKSYGIDNQLYHSNSQFREAFLNWFSFLPLFTPHLSFLLLRSHFPKKALPLCFRSWFLWKPA